MPKSFFTQSQSERKHAFHDAVRLHGAILLLKNCSMSAVYSRHGEAHGVTAFPTLWRHVSTFSSVSFLHEFFSFDDPSACPRLLFQEVYFFYSRSVTSIQTYAAGSIFPTELLSGFIQVLLDVCSSNQQQMILLLIESETLAILSFLRHCSSLWKTATLYSVLHTVSS